MALKDLFIKSDGVEQPTAEVKAAPSVSGAPKSFTAVSETKDENVTAVKQPSMDVKPTVMQSSITADEVIVNKVWDKIIAANRPGPDYLELKNNVEALEDLPISNEQKLISAFKVLKKGYPQFQKDDITHAIDFYVKVVEDEKAAGLEELEKLRVQNVNVVEETIESMRYKAEELKRQYDELQGQIREKTIELTQSKNDIDTKYNTFVGSIDAVLNVLLSDKENVMSINF